VVLRVGNLLARLGSLQLRMYGTVVSDRANCGPWSTIFHAQLNDVISRRGQHAPKSMVLPHDELSMYNEGWWQITNTHSAPRRSVVAFLIGKRHGS
jgi:hypothetical protein